MRSTFAAVLSLPVLLTGCAVETLTGPTAEPGIAIQGAVHGGQQPISGAHIYLLAANTTGYGGAGIAASSNNASVSVLSAVSTGTSDSIGAYVTSAADGTFSISGDYSCTPDTQVYLYALGGNSGAGTNSASGLLAALGNCPATGNFATATPFIIINEVTTIAAAYSFAGFATDATHVSSSATSLAKTGIKNAFANAANLAKLSSGTAWSTTPNGNGTVPQQLLNTLGDILASCINTNGAVNGPSSPTACYTLFNNALSGGSSGTAPTDTATAAINIAHNPGSNISTLLGLPTAQAPFSPQLSSAPNDFTVGIEFSGGGVNDPVAIAIDGVGNAWVADHGGAGTVSELSPAGVPISPSGGYLATSLSQFNSIAIDPGGNIWLPAYFDALLVKMSSSGAVVGSYNPNISASNANPVLQTPYAVAVDGSGNVWATDCGNQFCSSNWAVVELTSSGAVASPNEPFTGPLKTPYSIAIDGSGAAWVVNRDNNTVAEFSSAGTLLSSTGFTGGGLNKPYAIAIDHSGSAWVASYGSLNSSISEFSSTGSAISPSTGYTASGIDAPQAIAVDGAGQIWVADPGTKSAVHSNVFELSNTGATISPAAGYQGGNVGDPLGIAVDPSGNVWAVNGFASTVTQLIGAAAPVVTPLSVGVRDNTLGTRP
ncbi:MAG TPA: NHL repeat-containing protein [Acidobacteriaceae bacterium]|jgi:hypothetical protein|nr:NHL repeat-containing protein [Acidobacteriaceae bacterium]